METLGKTFEGPSKELGKAGKALEKAMQKSWQGHWKRGGKALKRRATLVIEYPEPYTLNPEP